MSAVSRNFCVGPGVLAYTHEQVVLEHQTDTNDSCGGEWTALINEHGRVDVRDRSTKMDTYTDDSVPQAIFVDEITPSMASSSPSISLQHSHAASLPFSGPSAVHTQEAYRLLAELV